MKEKASIKELEQKLLEEEKRTAILLGENARLILKQKDISYTSLSKKLKVGNSYITNRIQGKKRFTEAEMETIKNMANGKIEDIYIRYNKKQYEISNMSDYNKMNEEMAQLFMELLNEIEELL